MFSSQDLNRSLSILIDLKVPWKEREKKSNDLKFNYAISFISRMF